MDGQEREQECENWGRGGGRWLGGLCLEKTMLPEKGKMSDEDNIYPVLPNFDAHQNFGSPRPPFLTEKSEVKKHNYPQNRM